MKTAPERLRLLVNYGAVGYLLHFVGLFFVPALLFISPLVFNLAIWGKIKEGRNRALGLLCAGTVVLTSFIFFLQLLSREQAQWGCINTVSDWEINAGYTSTLILFSLLSWGFGSSWLYNRKPTVK
ncbi:hypothetical protein [Sabulibacter ruber]|uniref:hypothetical protein n=1 Tax=Sabulibacter ruber TaxID=2811901 RepID=UPI001A95D7CB|nr:hypothetical protein [Sabulibacter ruber]